MTAAQQGKRKTAKTKPTKTKAAKVKEAADADVGDEPEDVSRTFKIRNDHSDFLIAKAKLHDQSQSAILRGMIDRQMIAEGVRPAEVVVPPDGVQPAQPAQPIK